MKKNIAYIVEMHQGMSFYYTDKVLSKTKKFIRTKKYGTLEKDDDGIFSRWVNTNLFYTAIPAETWYKSKIEQNKRRINALFLQICEDSELMQKDLIALNKIKERSIIMAKAPVKKMPVKTPPKKK